MSLTMAQGMKRLAMPLAALLGVAMIGLIGTSWFLNRDALRQAVEAQIRVVTDGNGESNWTPFVETIARTMKPGAENQVSFSEIRIQDGALNYEDATNHVSEALGDIDLSLAWPSISRSFAATGQFDWRGERVDGSISVSDFVASLS